MIGWCISPGGRYGRETRYNGMLPNLMFIVANDLLDNGSLDPAPGRQ